MSTSSPSTLRWLYIPPAAQTGQIHAFADREHQLIHLYRSIVDAGNQVRKGVMSVRKKIVVHGYMGVGKSALILQALGLLRGDLSLGEVIERKGAPGGELPPMGQRITWAEGLPEPLDVQRWLVLRFSGKQMAGIAALPDDLQRRAAEEEARADTAENAPRTGLGAMLMGVATDVKQQAERQRPQVLNLPFWHHLLRSDELRLYEAVRSSLRQLSDVVDHIRQWEGGRQTGSLKITNKVDSSRDIEASLLGHSGKKLTDLSPDNQIALRVAADIIYKNSYLFESGTIVEKSWRVSAQMVVDVLNSFFEATDAASLPTLLILDDFDEFASAVGPSHDARARLLSWIIGPVTGLKPTTLVLALRSEYMMEDVFRQYESITVPPMDRPSALLAVEAWGEVQEPPLSDASVDRLKEVSKLILSALPEDAPTVIPFRFLQLLAWISNNTPIIPTQQGAPDLFKRYLRLQFSHGVAEAVLRAVEKLTFDDVLRCAAAEPLPVELFALSDRDRRELAKAGLLRPAMAGDPTNTDLVLDPLCAYLRAAQIELENRKKATSTPPPATS
jgi:hypothetical protein